MKGNMIGEWVRTVFRITVGSPKNLNDRFANPVQRPEHETENGFACFRFWSRKSIWPFPWFLYFYPPQVSFSEDAEKPSVAPLIPGFAITLLKIRINFRTWHTEPAAREPPVSKNLPALRHYRQLQEVFLLDAEPAQKQGIKTPRATPFLAASLFRITTTSKTTSISVS